MAEEMWYDDGEDILNVEFSSGKYWKSVELQNAVIDLDTSGKIKGIEIFNASKIFSGSSSKILKIALKENK